MNVKINYFIIFLTTFHAYVYN